MASIKKCLSKIKGFTSIKAEELISRTEEYQAEGMNQEDAARKVILEEYSDLNDRLNEIKSQLRIPKANVLKYSPEEAVKKVEEEFDKKDKEERDKKKAEGLKEKLPSIVNKIKSLTAKYNALTKKERKSEAGVNLYKTVSKMAEEIGHEITAIASGKLALINEKGKKVNRAPVKRSENAIEAEKQRKEFERKALNVNPISVEHAVVLDLWAGKRFNQKDFIKRSGVPVSEIPPLMMQIDGGIKFEFYAERMAELGAEVSQETDKEDIANEAADIAASYAQKGYRQAAKERAIEIYNEIQNGGLTEDEINSMVQAAAEEERYLNERQLEDTEIEEELEKEAMREEAFKETGQFQKKKESSQIENKDVDKVVERMKKALPKFSITYNPELEQAGKISGNKIEINPFYAGTDTPIHEAGHALIDFIGYNNKVIQTGIKQLKDTDLWKKTKERYSELSEEELGKEVLAEAIGLEGAGIFDTEAKKTRFKAVLDYIFTKLKQLLGIDKNIAKSLAKQIIVGVGTKEIETAQESAQKPKGEKKKAEPLSPEAQKVKDLYDDIKDIEDLSAIPYQDLVDAYNFVITNEEFSRTADGKKAKQEFLKRIGANFFEVASDKVKTDPNYSHEKAAKKDISGLDKLFKVLSHFNAEFPELKELSAMFNKAYFNKIKEAAEKKKVNLELAKEVIKEKNRQMGVVDWAKEKALSLIWNRNYKYFDYLDDGKGSIITVDEAKKKNLSKAQIDYLKFVRNTIAARAGVVENLEDNWNTEMQVLKTDKKFYENMATENAVSAVSSLLGNTWNINNTRIKFTNPNTGKEQVLPYEEIEKILVKYGQKGIKEKINAVRLIYKYNNRARRQLKENVNADERGSENVLNVVKSGDYSLTSNGKLVSKFDRQRSPNRAYSTNFFSAINEYIDDTEHIQHMQPLVPIVNAIDQLNRNGLVKFDEEGNKITVHGKKDNVAQWLKDWAEMHIIQRKKEFDPTVDNVVRFFRHLTSMSTMMYNIPAQGMNVVLGLYNQFRQENGKSVARGMKRFFGGGMNKKLNVGYAFGALNPYAIELIKKYKVVSTDLDSNPSRTIGNVITDMGYAGTKWGEFLVQGSHFLGLLDESDYNAFEFKKNKFGVDELVFKEDIPKKKREEIEKRILDSKDMVSDVHGKYDPKDRRNIMNFELGNSIMQFKTWVPDWWRIRFGKDVGSFRKNWEWAKDGMMKDIAEKGVVKAFWNNKAFMSNLKELGFITALMIFIYSDDDDEKKSDAAKVAQKALSDAMFVFDFNNAKFLVERPVASVGTVVKLIDAADHLIMNDADDFYKGKSKYGDKGDPKIQGDVMGMMPGRKVIEMLDEDEEEK